MCFTPAYQSAAQKSGETAQAGVESVRFLVKPTKEGAGAMKVKCPITPDADGFLSQECPFCNRVYKGSFRKGSRRLFRYCPYCGIEGQNAWYTVDQFRYLESVAAGHPGKMPVETSESMARHRFTCHKDIIIKYRRSGKSLYCPVCGCRSALALKIRPKKQTVRKNVARQQRKRQPRS
jgi:hypothetical protein